MTTAARKAIFDFLAPHLKDRGWDDVTFRASMDRHLDLYEAELKTRLNAHGVEPSGMAGPPKAVSCPGGPFPGTVGQKSP